MPNFKSCDKGKSSFLEEAKLIEEMQELVRVKGLDVNLIDKTGDQHRDQLNELRLADGCSSCTICPCIICW